MKKFVLLLVVLAAVGGLVALLVHDTDDGHAVVDARSAASAAEEQAAAEKARAAEHKPRVHAADESRPETLAVAGVVTTADGKPVSGATVNAYAVPAADDIPDEDRVGREFLTKAFGRTAGERLFARGKKLRGDSVSGDPSKLGDAMQDGMQMGMDMLADDGGMDAITAMMRMGREVSIADDGDWPLAGSASSAADGAFRIEGLSAGRIELRAKAPSHVKTKQRVTAGDSSVTIRLERGVRLAGIVTCDKEAVVGASVLAKGASTTSAAGGRFEFDAAHVPSETLIVSAENCCAQGMTVTTTLDGPASEVTVALDPAGSAAGHVSSVSGGPIAGARVTLGGSGNMFADMMGMAGGAGRFDVSPPPAVTDAAGAFELKGLHVGTAKLRVDADGWLGTTVSVEIKRGKASAVEALLLRESILSGTVTDEHGAPVMGAKVRVEVPPRDAASGMVANLMGGTFKSALSDAKGAYEVHGLAEGERKVRVEAAKYLTLEDKTAIPAQSAVTRDFTIREGFKLAGTVAGPDGKPFGGAKIYVAGKPPSGGASQMAAMFGGGRKKDSVAESGADGAWSADGLQEGPYVVTASADGFLDAETKDVAPGRKDVALTLGAAATIRGHVIAVADSKPVAGAAVRRKTPDGPGARGGRAGRGGGGAFAGMFGGGAPSATTDKDGAFEMKGLEPGAFELTASMRGFGDSQTATVTCVAGQTVDGIDLALPPGVTVTGRVVEKGTGAGVPGAVVWSGRADANPFAGMAASDFSGGDPQAPANAISARTDGDGRFVLDGLPPGKVTVEVRVRDHAPASAAGVVAPTTDVVVEVSGGGSVVGRVTGADGNPVAGSQVMAMRGMMGQGARQTKTDSNGDFVIDHLPAAAYTVMLLDPQNPMAPAMASVTVKDGETARHDFTKKAGGRQVGGAASKDGKPLANAPIMLMGGSAGLKMATTDDKGHFSFDGLEPGDYTVLVQSSFVNGGSASKKVSVGTDGKLADVNLELSSAKVEGDVVDAETGKGVAGAQIALMEPGAGAASGSGQDLLGTYRGQGFTDDRGHFAISDVQQGTFSLKASAAEYSPATLEGVASGATGVSVKLRRGVEFPVTVVGPDGTTPVANATVQTVDAAGNASMAFDMAMRSITREDGVARLRLASGTYTLKVTAADLLPAQVGVDTAAGSATVRLDAGATIEVAVTDGTAAVAGAKVKLLDAAGAEIKPGLTMASFMGGGDRTDAGGLFTRRGLPAGAATVVVTDAAGRETSADATLEMNKTRHVDVVVAK